MANLDPQIKSGLQAIIDATGDRGDLGTTDKSTFVASINEVLERANTITKEVNGQFLLDPNEFNGWANLGPMDNNNSFDLGNVGASPIHRLAGGYSFPFDVKVKRLFVWHRNTNNAAQAWGWRMEKQTKTANSNTATSSTILSEVADNAGVGPRDYGNTQNQNTDIDLSAVVGNTLTAGDVLVLGVEAPTANATNYYVQCMSGYIEFERV